MSTVIDSELQACISTARTISLVIGPFSMAVKLLVAALSGLSAIESLFLHFLFPVALSLFGVFFAWFRPKAVLIQQLALCLWTEFLLSFIKLVELQFFEHRALYASIAMGLMMTFQSRVLSSPLLIICFSFKFLIQWYLVDVFTGKLATSMTLMQCVGICFVFVLTYFAHSNRARFLGEIWTYRKSLEESRDNLNYLVDTLVSGLVIYDESLQLIKVNLKAQSWLTCRNNEVWTRLSELKFNRPSQELLDRSATVKEVLEAHQTIEMNASVSLGTVLLEDAFIDLKLSRIPWGQESAFVLVLTDISSSLLLEKTQAENALKTRFLQFIPHQLFTPTVGILGSAERALALCSELPAVSKSIDVILKSAKLLHLIISDILDYTQVISGVFTLHHEQVNLSTVVKDAMDLFIHQLERQGLWHSVRMDPSLPDTVCTDSRRLLQVLVMLLANAVKYTYKGGVEVVVILVKPGLIRFKVRDTGIGIQRAQLEDIQKQLCNSELSTSLFDLELANHHVQKLGGNRLRIQSQKGTVVTFLVTDRDCTSPDNVRSEASSNTVTEEQSHDFEVPVLQIDRLSSSILVVDDVHTNRAVLVSILESQHLESLQSKNGEEAVKLVVHCDQLNRPIKVIIMDIEMPVMDGWKATQAICQLHDEGKIAHRPYIIGYSAYSAPENFEKAKSLGMMTYIVKPVYAAEILRIVKPLLDRD